MSGAKGEGHMKEGVEVFAGGDDAREEVDGMSLEDGEVKQLRVLIWGEE